MKLFLNLKLLSATLIPFSFVASAFAQDADQPTSGSTNDVVSLELTEPIKLNPALLKALKKRFAATNETTLNKLDEKFTEEWNPNPPSKFLYKRELFHENFYTDLKKIDLRDTSERRIEAMITAKTSDELAEAMLRIQLQTRISSLEVEFLRVFNEMTPEERDAYVNLPKEKRAQRLLAGFKKANAKDDSELIGSSLIFELMKTLDNRNDLKEVTIKTEDGTQMTFHRAHDTAGNEGYVIQKPESGEDVDDFIGPKEPK